MSPRVRWLPHLRTNRPIGMDYQRILLAISTCAVYSGLLASGSGSDGPRLDPEIAFVSTGGQWAAGDRVGHIRVVVVNGGYEHVTSRVFVHWLDVDREKGARVVESRPVGEINDPGTWSVGQPVISHRGEVTIVRLSATNPYDGRETEFVLSVKGPGALGVERPDTPTGQWEQLHFTTSERSRHHTPEA